MLFLISYYFFKHICRFYLKPIYVKILFFLLKFKGKMIVVFSFYHGNKAVLDFKRASHFLDVKIKEVDFFLLVISKITSLKIQAQYYFRSATDRRLVPVTSDLLKTKRYPMITDCYFLQHLVENSRFV